MRRGGERCELITSSKTRLSAFGACRDQARSRMPEVGVSGPPPPRRCRGRWAQGWAWGGDGGACWPQPRFPACRLHRKLPGGPSRPQGPVPESPAVAAPARESQVRSQPCPHPRPRQLQQRHGQKCQLAANVDAAGGATEKAGIERSDRSTPPAAGGEGRAPHCSNSFQSLCHFCVFKL